MIERPSPNWNERPAGTKVDLLILHYTGMQSAEAALGRLADPAAQVSAHYVIDEDGTTYRMVDESRRAWHAGVSAWHGRGDVNAFSVGIEIVNPGHEWGYRPFPAAQMAACTALARAVVQRHGIPPWRVLGHSDVAPERKEDPGELFDWAGLAHAGVGLWPDVADAPDAPGLGPGDAGPHVAAVQQALARFGYTCPASGTYDAATERVVVAFQRHYRQERLDGRFDAACRRRLDWLLAQMD